jgi:hypothetical protein
MTCSFVTWCVAPLCILVVDARDWVRFRLLGDRGLTDPFSCDGCSIVLMRLDDAHRIDGRKLVANCQSY